MEVLVQDYLALLFWASGKILLRLGTKDQRKDSCYSPIVRPTHMAISSDKDLLQETPFKGSPLFIGPWAGDWASVPEPLTEHPYSNRSPKGFILELSFLLCLPLPFLSPHNIYRILIYNTSFKNVTLSS